MNIHLTSAEARVLGSLIEKEITTPEYYPLSLNALLNACNQKSNREPITNLDEDAIRQALHSLDRHGLARSAATDGRVPKFEHRLQEAFNFHRHEIALLCVLLLRGPQTPGELRTRCERLYQFDDLNAVHSALNLLMKRDPPLVTVLPRQPGTKEARYAHLLSGDIHETPLQPSSAEPPTPEPPATAAALDRTPASKTKLPPSAANLPISRTNSPPFKSNSSSYSRAFCHTCANFHRTSKFLSKSVNSGASCPRQP